MYRERIKCFKKIRNNKLNNQDKYFWELYQLQDKLIIDENCNIFEELEDCVDEALKIKIDTRNRNIKEFNVFVVGIIKINASTLTMALKSIINGIYKMNDELTESILYGSPFIHYYCGVTDRWMESYNEYKEEFYYRDYEGLLEDIDEKRKEYGIAGSMPFNPDSFSDMFYYGMPLDNPTCKKLYDEILKSKHRDFLFDSIEMRRIFNTEDYIADITKITGEKLNNLINEGIKEIPCTVMNGFTPNLYYKEKEEEKINNVRFTHVTQNDAHLPRRGADQFYKLYFALLDYTNKKYNINPNVGKIYKQEGLDVRELASINDYLFENKNIIDEFIKDNSYTLNEEELEIISGFKTALKKDMFVVVGYERNYTKILSPEEGKIYMVKGVRDNLDKVLKNFELPIIIKTTLLMFKGNIIYNSFLSNYNIGFGNDIKRSIINDYEKAMEYYHL